MFLCVPVYFLFLSLSLFFFFNFGIWPFHFGVAELVDFLDFFSFFKQVLRGKICGAVLVDHLDISKIPSTWEFSSMPTQLLNFFFFFLYVLGLHFCAIALSSCGERGPLFIAVRGPLAVAASLVAEHRLQTRRLSSCGSRAQLLRGMWDLPRPGLEPVSPALAGRLSTAAPPGKPPTQLLICWYTQVLQGLFPRESPGSSTPHCWVWVLSMIGYLIHCMIFPNFILWD